MKRNGFTLIELLIAITLMGIIASIALPNYHDAKLRAQAAKVISDFDAIRTAVYDHYAATGSYPSSGGWGQVPRDLVASLPDGFEFRYENVRYRWQHWSFTFRWGNSRIQWTLLAVMMMADDGDLLRIVRNTYKGGRVIGNNRYLYFIFE